MQLMRYTVALFALTACVVLNGVTPEVKVVGTTISCPNASRASNFQSGDYQAFTCTWDCANYAGASRIYVQLTYVWDGRAWRLDSTYTDRGICGSYDRSPVGV